MNRMMKLFICMAFLLVCTTNGFATVIWSAPSSGQVYSNINMPSTNPVNYWDSGILNLASVQGAPGPLTFTMNVTVSGNWETEPLLGPLNPITNMTPYQILTVVPLNNNPGSGNPLFGNDHLPAYGGLPTAHSLVFDIAYNPLGVYRFWAYSAGTEADARWTMDGFSLSNSDPAPTPIPAAVWLLGSGLMGLVGYKRSRKTSLAT